MLTRFVRIQLIIFLIAGVVGIAAMAILYVQVPTLLGIGRMTVTLELPAGGGLYRFGNVTYRGVQVGKVTHVDLTPHGVQATLSLASSAKIPVDLEADVRSVSAMGEQYVDLRPRTASGPYLHNGSVIALSNSSIPQPVGPMLDKTVSLLERIPQDSMRKLVDASYEAFNGAGDDFSSLMDSSKRISAGMKSVTDETRTLTEDTGPILDSQAQTADEIRLWARSVAGITEQVAVDDAQARTLLQNGPGAFDQASGLLEDIKPALPTLLANLNTVGQIGVAYHASIEQLLVLFPPFVAAVQSFAGKNNPSGLAYGDFAVIIDDPPPCTMGFLPPSSWRSPADTTTIDTPDGLYCKLPQDSPIAVRGARNYPCMERPGKRAPTVEICESDKPYEPLAMRQHSLGAYPLDPNLLSQGIMPDDRIGWAHDQIYGPVEGTALPPWVPQAEPAAAGGPPPPAAPNNLPDVLVPPGLR